jgi:hypothetical protein
MPSLHVDTFLHVVKQHVPNITFVIYVSHVSYYLVHIHAYIIVHMLKTTKKKLELSKYSSLSDLISSFEMFVFECGVPSFV